MQSATATPSGAIPPASALGEGYRPGSCNIGAFEIARRKRSALVGGITTALVALLLLAVDAPPPARLLVLFPLWGTLVTWLQVRRRFCVGFAVAGLRNLGPDRATQERVTDPGALDADRRAAAAMIRDAFLLALGPAILVALLPR